MLRLFILFFFKAVKVAATPYVRGVFTALTLYTSTALGPPGVCGVCALPVVVD